MWNWWRFTHRAAHMLTTQCCNSVLSIPHPPPVMTEPHPMAKQRPTGSPHNERKCLLSILPHVNSCEFEFGGYGSRVMMS